MRHPPRRRPTFTPESDPNDLAQRMHLPDPADPAVTVRVLMIMLAEEY